jgi:hypothetical protein
MRRISLLLLTLAPCLLGYIRLNTGETTPVVLQRVDNTGIQFYLNSQIMPGATSSASGKTVTVITANSNPSQAIASAQAMWNNVTTANVKFLPVMPTTVTHATQDPNNLINVISIAASTAELSAVNGVVALTLNTWYSSSGVINGLNVNDGSGGFLLDGRQHCHHRPPGRHDSRIRPHARSQSHGRVGRNDVSILVPH